MTLDLWGGLVNPNQDLWIRPQHHSETTARQTLYRIATLAENLSWHAAGDYTITRRRVYHNGSGYEHKWHH